MGYSAIAVPDIQSEVTISFRNKDDNIHENEIKW